MRNRRRRGGPEAGGLSLPPGAHGREHAGDGTGMLDPSHHGRQAGGHGRRSLPARAGCDVQASRAGGSRSEHVRAFDLVGGPAHPVAGAVPHAPVPFAVPVQRLLRGCASERGIRGGQAVNQRRLSVAQPVVAYDVLVSHRRRRDFRVWDILPQPRRGVRGGEGRDALT